MTKKTVLITGASSGIGRIIANTLHDNGYTVIGTSRNPKESQSGVPFKLLQLDLTDDKSINTFNKRLFNHIGQLDILINNAGFYVSGFAEETPIELGRQQFETNFWGTVKFTNELLPHFRKQRHGKIITIGSVVGLVGLPSAAYYAASKHAIEGYFKALRFELHDFNISVSVVEPSMFKTSINSNAVVSKNKIQDYNTYRKKVAAFENGEFGKAPTPEPVANTVMKIVRASKPRYSYPVGGGSSLLPALQYFSYSAYENAIFRKLNAVSAVRKKS